MSQIKLTIQSIEPAKKKDGSFVAGIAKNGKKWQVFKVNRKYDYMCFGDLDVENGKTYLFEEEVEQTGDFTNYRIKKIDEIIDETEEISVVEDNQEDYSEGVKTNGKAKQIKRSIEEIKNQLTIISENL